MIVGEIRRYLRDNTALRISRGTRDLAYRAYQMREQLTRDAGHEASIEEIAEALGESASDISEALEAVTAPMSLYEPVFNEGDDVICLMDQLSDGGDSDLIWLDNIALKEAMRLLDNREKKIINMRFFRNRTQMEIAEEIGISQAQVSRLEKGALLTIRKQMSPE